MTPTHAPAPPRTRLTGTDVLRGLLATGALLGFVLGVPAALLVVAPMTLPDTWPTWDSVTAALTRPDNGSLLLGTITVLAWAGWALFTAQVLAEITAAARNVPAPHLPLPLPGAVQHFAATLVTTAGLLLTTTTPLASPTAAQPTVTVPMTVLERHPATAAAPDQPDTPRPPAAPAAATEPAADSPAGPTVTVTRGDTLWGLAERHLGDGHRYTEIIDLNLARPQPDGRTLTDNHWLYPGWQIHLPSDATSSTRPPEPQTATSADAVHTVAPGDTLWDIAATHLGDPTRYPEIAALNHGITQPDGHTLTDPDLIEPGWTLALPDDAAVDLPAVVTHSPTRTGPAPGPTTPAPAPAASPDDATARVPDADARGDDAQAGTGREAGVRDDALPGRDDAGNDADLAAPAELDDDEADDDAADGDDAVSTQAFFLGLTALAAAGVVGEVTRRRALQHRTRRTGHHIPLPAPGSPTADAERTLRAAAPPVTIPALKQALLNLTSRCYTAERDLPRLAAITLTPDHVTLHLTDDDTDPVPPFHATDPRTWTAPHTALAGDDPIDDPDRPEPFPALVTAGHTTDATVLLNLEAAGTLTLTGNPNADDGDGPGDVLRALVAELTTSDLTGRIGLVADPQFAALAAASTPTRLQIATPQAIADQLTHRQAAVSRALAGNGTDDTLQARSDRVVGDVWLPVVYVTPGAANTAPWSGNAIIGLGEPTPGGWSIRVDGTQAALEPLGIQFQPQRFTASDLAILVDLLSTAAPADTEPAATSPAVSNEIAATLAALPVDIPTSSRPATVRINVLGPVTIDGLPAGRRLSPRPTELLVYLALRGQATGPELDEALWHGLRIDSQTRNSLVYRTRQRVGPHVLPTVDANNTYRLGDDVACDWTQFQHLARRGLQTMPGGLAELQAAMDLVCDRPLLGVPDSGYTWAEYDIQHMIATIADTAHILARAHTQQGNHRVALATATKGLLVDGCSETLHRDAIHAAEALGDHTEATRLITRYETDLAVLDPDLV